jgi:hypothetical protein
VRTSYRATVVRTTDPAEKARGWVWTVVAEYPGGEVFRWTWRTKAAAEAYAKDMRRRHGHQPLSDEGVGVGVA